MDKWSIERDPSTLMCHYIAKKNTVLSRISGACEANVTELSLGMLVEVREEQADGGLRIRVNGTNNEKIWHKTEWRCHKIDLIKVPTLVWQFLAAIPVLQERVEIASNERLCQEAAKFKEDINVWYRSSRNAEKTLAVIRYIGPAPELGPGFHFGLELLDDRESATTSASSRQFPANAFGNLTLATLSDVRPFEFGLSEEVKPSELRKALSVENVSNEYYFDGPPKSSSNNHISNGKRIQQDFSAAFDERLTIFDDRNNNNSGSGSSDPSPHLSNALIPKVAHKSAKSKILVNDASSLLSRNHDGFEFPGNTNNFSIMPLVNFSSKLITKKEEKLA